MGQRILLVEGLDDQHVLWALFQAHSIPQTFKVEKSDGVEQLLESVPVRLKASNLERFAIILDADENIQLRWEQLRTRLLASGCASVPEEPQEGGTVVQIEEGARVGIWIMPDNKVSGILENFLSFLIPKEDQLLPLVDRFLTEIPVGERRYPAHRLPKVRIHTWLALQEEPGKPLGQAITAKYLDARQPIVFPFLEWIKIVLVD